MEKSRRSSNSSQYNLVSTHQLLNIIAIHTLLDALEGTNISELLYKEELLFYAWVDGDEKNDLLDNILELKYNNYILLSFWCSDSL